MRHLFNSRVEVLRLSGSMEHGTPRMEWRQIPAIVDRFLGKPGEMMCRIDLGFQRLGKDTPMPVAAGRAPDRIGVMCFSNTNLLLAGDRVRCVAGPIQGTFEIRAIPDPAVGFSLQHHVEVQVVEVAQNVVGRFPGATPDTIVIPDPDDTP
jgi:hypothetical protein